MKGTPEIITVAIVCYLIGDSIGHVIKKRQIFREQVLPHAGGKIPDSAFHTDRLALNRLQKEGIAVPDGVLLEQRMYQVHPHLHRSVRPTFRVALTPEKSFSSTSGEHHFVNAHSPAIDSTYSIPQQWKQKVKLPPKIPSVPVYRPFKFPTKYDEQPQHYQNSLTVGGDGQHHYFKHRVVHPPQPPVVQYHAHQHQYHQAHQIISPPYVHAVPPPTFHSTWPSSYWRPSAIGSIPYEENYLKPQIFSNFDDYFNSLHARVARDDNEHTNIIDGSSKLLSTTGI